MSTAKPHWTIFVREVHAAGFRVALDEAPTLKEAVRIVRAGGGEYMDDAEFTHRLGVETWTAEAPDGTFHDQLEFL